MGSETGPRDIVKYRRISLTRRRTNKHQPTGGAGHLIWFAQRPSGAVGEVERDDDAQMCVEDL